MKLSRNKGAAFERDIAHRIRDRFGLTAKDVYRTPLSGGHPFGDAGDLVMSEAAVRAFPFLIECKHVKRWHPGLLLNTPMSELELAYRAQARAALRRSVGRGKRWPMVVVMGDRTAIYCSAPREATLHLPLPFIDTGDGWRTFDFRDFLRYWKPRPNFFSKIPQQLKDSR